MLCLIRRTVITDGKAFAETFKEYIFSEFLEQNDRYIRFIRNCTACSEK